MSKISGPHAVSALPLPIVINTTSPYITANWLNMQR